MNRRRVVFEARPRDILDSRGGSMVPGETRVRVAATKPRPYAQVAFIGALDGHHKVVPLGTKVSLEYGGWPAVRPGTRRATRRAGP